MKDYSKIDKLYFACYIFFKLDIHAKVTYADILAKLSYRA